MNPALWRDFLWQRGLKYQTIRLIEAILKAHQEIILIIHQIILIFLLPLLSKTKNRLII